jgi:translocation and assembly module TamA
MVREREEVDLSVVQGGGTLRADGDSLELTLEERLQLSRKLGLALAYNVQWLDLTFPELKLAPLSFRPARLIATGVVDGRNGILDPTNGFFSSVSANYGAEFLGSEFDFTRTFLQQYLYLPLGRGFLSASGARYERGSGNQAFLTTERLPLGGPTTVRGYDRENVDIIDLVALQGITTHVLVLNQELRFPIWSDLRGVAFLDYGQFWSGLEGARATFWRLGTGLGLRYSTPVGVLRFDVGYALKDGDRRPRYYVGLGQAF